jgi:hypothetical protein
VREGQLTDGTREITASEERLTPLVVGHRQVRGLTHRFGKPMVGRGCIAS